MFPLPFALIVCWIMTWTVQAASSKPPNILLILADDMGYGDAGFAGQYLRTPNWMHWADSGVVCTQAYVCSPICSPSPAGLLTGRDPRRFGYQANLNQASRAMPPVRICWDFRVWSTLWPIISESRRLSNSLDRKMAFGNQRTVSPHGARLWFSVGCLEAVMAISHSRIGIVF